MKLYFLRHGEAEEGKDIEDHDRRLTTNGIERTSTAAKVMTKLDIVPLYIYSSPRVRARQTADILAQQLGMGVDIREELNFSFNLKAVEKLIAELKPEDDVMFVGHEPSFSATIGALTGGRVEMKKGGLARVDVISTFPLRGMLVWLIAPKIFDVLDSPDEQ